jgi:hypothetical protein
MHCTEVDPVEQELTDRGVLYCGLFPKSAHYQCYQSIGALPSHDFGESLTINVMSTPTHERVTNSSVITVAVHQELIHHAKV